MWFKLKCFFLIHFATIPEIDQMDGASSDSEMGRRFDSEDFEGIDDPMSPAKNKGDNNMANNITLWQFLLELLLNGQFKQIICWTNNEGEFKLVNAEEVARLWGLRKNKNNMNYDKLSRALRYYYDKNIIKKVLGQKFVYRFVSFPEIIKTESKLPFHVKMEALGPSKVNSGPVSPYSSGMSHSPMSSSAPSPSGSGVHNGRVSSPAQQPSRNLSTPPPAHIASYPAINPLAHMYQAAFSQMAAAASLGGYLSALARRPEGAETTSSHSISPSMWPPQETCSARSPSPVSEDSRDTLEVPLHLVSEEASRRRREEEAEERRREEGKKSWHSPSRSPIRSRSPLSSPRPHSPLTPPPIKDCKPLLSDPPPPPISSTSSSPHMSPKGVVSRVRSGPKPKPSPLSIEAITGAPPVVSPRQFSASSLNTPVVSLPSPPYSGVGTKSPYFPLQFWSSLSPLASLSPHYGSPRSHRHFTFPALPSQYPPIPPHVLSPLLSSATFDFSSHSSPTEKTTTVPVLQ